MGSFKSALEKGLQSLAELNTAQEEINALVSELSRDLGELSGGQVKAHSESRLDAQKRFEISLSFTLVPDHLVILSAEEDAQILFGYSLSKRGFPVTISFPYSELSFSPAEDVVCTSITTFRKTLEEHLSLPEVARFIAGATGDATRASGSEQPPPS